MSRRMVDHVAVEVLEPPTGTSEVPVLLLHGIGGSADTFAGVAPRLVADGWTTIAWDAPGYGASPDPAPEVHGPRSTETYVDAVRTLLAGMGVKSVHLVGVSWGGVIATWVAAEHPALVASLALVDSTRGSAVSPDKAAAMRSRVTELVELGGRAFAARRAPRLLADGAARDVATVVEHQMAQVRPAGYAGAAAMMAQSDTGVLLSSLRIPTLVLVGDQDRVTGVAESELLADRIPGARLQVIEHAGHAAVQEQPGAVAEALLGFLREQTTPEPTHPVDSGVSR